jgi:hypothetical protein
LQCIEHLKTTGYAGLLGDVYRQAWQFQFLDLVKAASGKSLIEQGFGEGSENLCKDFAAQVNPQSFLNEDEVDDDVNDDNIAEPENMHGGLIETGQKFDGRKYYLAVNVTNSNLQNFMQRSSLYSLIDNPNTHDDRHAKKIDGSEKYGMTFRIDAKMGCGSKFCQHNILGYSLLADQERNSLAAVGDDRLRNHVTVIDIQGDVKFKNANAQSCDASVEESNPVRVCQIQTGTAFVSFQRILCNL